MNIIKKENFYNALICGAKEVMQNRFILNDINVFPVADSDTGNNLYSMMQSIILHSEIKYSLKATLESIADSAIVGARGNSGLIFAQYFYGLSKIPIEKNEMSIKEFALAAQIGFTYASEAVEKPVEGTILTIMKVFYESLHSFEREGLIFQEILEKAYANVQKAVHKTTNQLYQLKNASVVDSGAMGFAFFLKGVLNGIGIQVEKSSLEFVSNISSEYYNSDKVNHVEDDDEYIYCTESLLEGSRVDISQLKKDLSSFGGSLIVAGGANNVRLHIHTNIPSDIFEFLERKGYTVLSQKVDDMMKKKDMVYRRKYKTLIITDSIADIPNHILSKEQVGVINLKILLGIETYIDKLTITNNQLFKLAIKKDIHPTSSQPSINEIKDIFEDMLYYYDEILVIAVSKELSGTFNVLSKVSKSFGDKVKVYNSKQNSVAQGLIVWRAIEGLKAGKDSRFIQDMIERDIKNSKILVSIKTLDNMIASGRLSIKKGLIAKKIGLNPIITLTANGSGAIEKIAFSSEDANKKILKHLYKVHQKSQILHYAITYVDDKEAGENLALRIQEVLGFPCEYIVESSSIIAAGAGKGALAVAYVVS